MAEFIIVGSSDAFQLESAANYSRRVTHEGGQTVYYSTSTRVGPTINDGSLTTGQQFTFTGRRFFITQSGTGTQGSSASLRLDNVPVAGETVASTWVNVKDFGAKGDGATDDAAAFEAARDSVAAAVNSSRDGPAANLSGRLGVLYVPRGQYYLSRTFHIKRIMHLLGEGGLGWYPASELIFPDNVPGVVVDYYLDNYVASVDGGRGDWSTISHIGVTGQGRSSSSAHGFELRANATLENFAVNHMGGDGVHIDAGVPTNNANLFRISRGTVYYCKNGVRIHGNDSNAGLIEQVDASNCDRWGFHDDSFLGNTYIMCHAATNNSSPGGASGGGYSMGYVYDSNNTNTGGNLSASTLYNCYAESGQNQQRLDQYVLAINCVFGDAPLTAGKGVTLAPDNAGLKSNQAIRVVNASATKNTTAILGSGPAYASTSHRALAINTDDASSDYNLDYDDELTGWWAWNRGGSAAKVAWATSGGSASVGDGQFAVPNGLYIGGTTGAKVKAFLSATTTWDPASIADGAMTSTTLGVTSAAVGDTVTVGFSNAVPAGAILSGAVTSAGTVSVTLFNKTGAPLDLASGTLRADVWQH